MFTLKPNSKMMHDLIRQDGLMFDGLTDDIKYHIKNFLNRMPHKILEGITNHGGLHARGDSMISADTGRAKDVVANLGKGVGTHQ